MRTNDVILSYEGEKLNLKTRLLDDDEWLPLVLIEGGARELSFLGDLLHAMAREAEGSGFQMAPDGAGNAHFAPGAKLGIYIHRI